MAKPKPGKATPIVPTYGRNALRPNPSVADPARGLLAFAQGTVLIGDFGSDGAAVRPAVALPPVGPPKTKGRDDETAIGWR